MGPKITLNVVKKRDILKSRMKKWAKKEENIHPGRPISPASRI
jgi:hypothetical protein